MCRVRTEMLTKNKGSAGCLRPNALRRLIYDFSKPLVCLNLSNTPLLKMKVIITMVEKIKYQKMLWYLASIFLNYIVVDNFLLINL